jgi:hypothetical protein
MILNTQARVRSWLSWVPLLTLGLAGIIGYRLWTDKLEQSPVAEPHSAFLNFMVEHSPNAREYRNRYYRKFGRDSVASKHYEQVCAAMVRSTVDDGVDPATHSEPMANVCKSLGRKYPPGELPHEGSR